MNSIAQMVRETKVLTKRTRKRMYNELIDEFPTSNEEKVEIELNNRMQQTEVSMFIKLFKNNLKFYHDLMSQDLMQRIIEQKERLINQEFDSDPDLDEENELLYDSVELCREDIEELFPVEFLL